MEAKTIEAVAKLIDALAWPGVALIAGVALFCKAPSILAAIRRAPFIRKISFQGFELELDLKSIDELQEQTGRALAVLIQKTDREVQRIIKLSDISQNLIATCNKLYRLLPSKDESFKANGNLRCTLHVNDAVFSEYLYQACNYYYPWTQRFQPQTERSSGRRFSIRYGIIGLAARTAQTQIEQNALQGSAEEVQNLISHWSMTPTEAESAKTKPSCLAIILRDPESSKFLGVLYADAIQPAYFGTKGSQSDKFLTSLQSSDEYKQLLRAMRDLISAISQIQIAIDLNTIENMTA